MSGTAPADRLTPVDDIAGRTIYYDSDSESYHTWCVDDEYEPATTALLLTVASVQGVEPDELEALSDRVDPDALNTLVTHWQADTRHVDGSLSFPFADCTVTVYANGEIVIDPR
ncbi:HalOD1 output domain-containing protein [Natronobacterium gregoryi]|uniref:Halobacterial output domain-containing protein n=2 Tax=Natronobacterium gregoryi TaxID=44930 RepID=L0AG18_NATGS|nr:HalOD1 output domain-containing protein [Natronobacterium gregoryi]AFZ72015.1 hypothetical protein Natgr_0773 [Natronobacterium gregoryi SP2]ELY62710.1 hypothetical protein C490_17397 [Natronobacterium gregoryi SP2]PLK20866.1 hypothetical protein CYV19_07240 [Natronobacterium gregoryi SP2]SFJ20026.1 hypothetical protein SAMN05443661_11753 [Natronobacterium gregoryi]